MISAFPATSIETSTMPTEQEVLDGIESYRHKLDVMAAVLRVEANHLREEAMGIVSDPPEDLKIVNETAETLEIGTLEAARIYQETADVLKSVVEKLDDFPQLLGKAPGDPRDGVFEYAASLIEEIFVYEQSLGDIPLGRGRSYALKKLARIFPELFELDGCNDCLNSCNESYL